MPVPAPQPTDPRVRAAALGSVVVAVFLAWQALAHRSWLSTDTRPPAWDRAMHLELAQKPPQLRPAAPENSPPWPPLYHLMLSPFVAGDNPADGALWLNWVFLAVLSFGLLALGVYFRPDSSAAAGALLVAASPGTMELLHSHLPDLGVMALVTLAYCAAVYSEGFRRWPQSIAFAVLFAAGMHFKWSFFTYVLPAIYQALRALEKPESRGPAGAALALGALLSAPWYAANAGLLIPRLLGSIGGLDVSAFAGFGLARYLFDLMTWLGPVFFLFGFIGLMIPQYHRAVGQGWMMTAWFLSSYVLWSLLPQRQLRFIMPAAPSLAVAGTGAWPTQLLWVVAAVQLLGASNYTQGWINEIKVPTPLVDLAFFPSDPAQSADWRAETIIKAAAAAHQVEHPSAALAVAAGHPLLNAASLAYEARRQRSVVAPVPAAANHFGMAEFVLYKTGTEGALPSLIKDRKSWFGRAYDELERWKLPDGTEAVLYQQARFGAEPMRESTASFQYYEAPESGVEAEDVSLKLGPWDAARGSYASATLRGRNVKARGLDFGDVELELRDVLPAPTYGKSGALEEIRILRVGELEVKRAQLSAAAVEASMEAWAPGLDLRSVQVTDVVRASGRFRGLEVTFSAAPKLTAETLSLELRDARLGPVNVSPAFMGALAGALVVPLKPSPEKPFTLRLAGLRTASGGLSIP